MRIALAQLDPVVGAFEANFERIQTVYQRAIRDGARICVTPELSVCGYPPHDLIERPEIYERCDRIVDRLRLLTQNQPCALIVGAVRRNPRTIGRIAENAAYVLDRGEIAHVQSKSLLPTYDVFDEARYFESAQTIDPWICDGKTVAVVICEDLWAQDPSFGRRLYGQDPVKALISFRPDLVISLSASPFEIGKRARRERIHREVVHRIGAPLVYVNQVGATDEILFDGASFVAVPGEQEAKVVQRLSDFKAEFQITDLETLRGAAALAEVEDSNQHLIEALVMGIREYFKRSGFKEVVLGLSGGIDSACVAALAVKALGAAHVLGVAMPSIHSSAHSLSDAEDLARRLKIRLEVRPIKFIHSVFQRELSQVGSEVSGLALENLQSRIRGTILMTLANQRGALVLATGNKSELATGYCTLYGDLIGALAPLGDLTKTRVYAVSRKINEIWGEVIPQSSLLKAPSAELSPGQTDQDTLPPYDLLDALIEDHIEERLPEGELIARHDGPLHGRTLEIIRRIEAAEYKRRQSPPILRVTSKAFGIGRRIPIAKSWERC